MKSHIEVRLGVKKQYRFSFILKKNSSFIQYLIINNENWDESGGTP